MKQTIQQKIVKEIVNEKKKDPSVIAIAVFGSVALGLERQDSDVDIEIITTKGKNWKLIQQKIDGITVDLEICNKNYVLGIVKDHPFLCYSYLKEKVIYDSKGFLKNIINKLKKYFKKHPEIVKFWEEKRKAMREAKKKGKKPENPFRVYDEAEIKFSKKHKVTRKWFRD